MLMVVVFVRECFLFLFSLLAWKVRGGAKSWSSCRPRALRSNQKHLERLKRDIALLDKTAKE